MASEIDDITNLVQILRENGDQILDASSKLSLSTTLLKKINDSFGKFSCKDKDGSRHDTFQVTSTIDIVESFFDLQLLLDFIQKTLALKILPGCDDVLNNRYFVDINIFKNLKLLEVHRFSLGLIKGLKNLRAQLEYLTCMRSLNNLKEVLENCGADKCQGFLWGELKEAVFSHNGLSNLDGSLEFVPSLNTLDLSHNYIQNAQPLNCLTNLKHLNLSYNQLERIPKPLYTYTGNLCNSLEILVLRNNYIDDIKEIVFLPNLKELDLSDNCLFDHNILSSLSYLPYLRWLCLVGNPLSYHTKHRSMTAKYLHSNASSVQFKLDYVTLSRSEQRLVGSFRPVQLSLERSSSFNSTTTASTVIRVDKEPTKQCVQQDLTSYTSIESSEENNYNLRGMFHNKSCMQDSGFVAGPRPASPSECSIGSANSLNSDINENSSNIEKYESDIEVLSNPSQSSIEVLDSGSAYIRYSASVLTLQTVQESVDHCSKSGEHVNL